MVCMRGGTPTVAFPVAAWCRHVDKDHCAVSLILAVPSATLLFDTTISNNKATTMAFQMDFRRTLGSER
jgi:hypothetical protein